MTLKINEKSWDFVPTRATTTKAILRAELSVSAKYQRDLTTKR